MPNLISSFKKKLDFEIPNSEKVMVSDNLFILEASENGRVHKPDTHHQTELEPAHLQYSVVRQNSLKEKDVATWEDLWISTRTLTFYWAV